MTSENKTPLAAIIAGPNGAGKTTMAPAILESYNGLDQFVNADIIARTISPLNPENAALRSGKLMLRRIQELIDIRESFLLETTLSGRTYVQLFNRLHKAG